MPKCSGCQIIKEVSEFFFRDKTQGKLHSQCKCCHANKRRAYYQEHYRKYGSKYRERAIARKIKVKGDLRRQLLKYLSDKSCSVCGIADPRVLDFDHIDRADKSFGISRALTNTLSWKKILLEIKKCQILCANCHRIRTSNQFGWYRNG